MGFPLQSRNDHCTEMERQTARREAEGLLTATAEADPVRLDRRAIPTAVASDRERVLLGLLQYGDTGTLRHCPSTSGVWLMRHSAREERSREYVKRAS